MSKKNREARKQEPTFTKTVTLPGKVERVSVAVNLSSATPADPEIVQRLEAGKVGEASSITHPDAGEPAAPTAPMTQRERALAVAAIVEGAMVTFGHRYAFRMIERPRGLDVIFGTPGAPERCVEMVRQAMAKAMPEVMVEGKRRVVN